MISPSALAYLTELVSINFYFFNLLLLFVTKLCPTLCHPMDCVAHQTPLSMGFSRQEYWSGLADSLLQGSSWPREQTHISCIGRRILYHWATREAQFFRVCAKSFSSVWTFWDPVDCGLLGSSVHSRQEYWSGLPCPSPGDFPEPGIEIASLMSPALTGKFFFQQCHLGSPFFRIVKWSEVAQSCPILCDPMDYSLPGFSVHGIFQARILEWVAISFSRGSYRPRDQTQVSHNVSRCFTLWATREAPFFRINSAK